ncbi:MAG: protein-L-isoaspartate(D-aspartate) O-methyltransferase [Actinobacteria bacterium]|nr:protein-L-isoaspartate(D-aspartate) O-methyltransferase [Actinomycetota bacterium]MBM3713212.1 protein-L-isoaspartate(D-aspartate) O-methyltransferase [Actinomycetota bacterium]
MQKYKGKKDLIKKEALVQNRFSSLRENMVQEQIISRGIKDIKVLEAMKKVPREEFVDEDMKDAAYDDRPLPIGFSQTISQPYIVALMTESLELSGDEKVLEIGTGSGYQTAVLAEITREIYSVEIVKPLYERAKKILSKYKNIKLSSRDGYFGWKEFAPFDRIIVTAAPENVPEPLVEQLKNGGIMVLPSGPSGWSQTLLKITKKDGKIKTDRICDVAFVPLTRKKFN